MRQMGYWLVLIVALLVTASCGGGNDDSDSGKNKWGGKWNQAKKAPLVETLPVRVDDIARFERSTGRITARNTAEVMANVAEDVIQVFVDVGDYVEQGFELARLDDRVYRLALENSSVALREAELNRDKLKLDLVDTQAELDRILKYFDPDKPDESRLFSKDAYQQALLARDKARNDLESADLAVQRARGDVASNALTLSHTIIRAPISGYITTRNTNANEMANTTEPLFIIADFSELEVALDVPESALRDIHVPKGEPAVPLFGVHPQPDFSKLHAVVLGAAGFPQERFLGYVRSVSPVVDDARGMGVVFVRIIPPESINETTHSDLLQRLDDIDRSGVLATAKKSQSGTTIQLRPGMWVDARIATRWVRDAMLVPSAALVGATAVIWAVREKTIKGKKKTVVTRIEVTGRRDEGGENSFRLLPPPGESKTTDLKKGDQIVVRGQSLLKDGDEVRPRSLAE